MEIWKPVKGFEETYEVSNLGKVRSIDRVRYCGNGFVNKPSVVLKQGVNKRGYSFVNLHKNKRSNLRVVHRLMADAFLKMESHHTEVNHINGVKTDNFLENLEWVSHKENMQHAIRTGLRKIKKGESVSGARFTNSQVIEIRECFKSGDYTKSDLARKYNVGFSVMGKLLNNQTYQEVER